MRPLRLLPPPLAVFALAGTALAACSGTGDSGASPAAYAAPPPPLPTSVPAARFDPATSLASVDGAVVAELTGGWLRFHHGDGGAGAPEGIEVDPAAELRALSADGSLAALLVPLADDRTRIVVVADPAAPARLPPTVPASARTVELDGLVEPEAFTTDGSALFVIDHRAGAGPGTYRVRPLDLATGALQDALGPTKVPLDEDMHGRGVRQVWSPDGTRLYTLYLRQHPHGGDGGSVGLVHVLDLVEEWAYCVDLPAGFGAAEPGRAALAVAPDGLTLAVADLDAGQMAFVSTRHLAVSATAPLPGLDLPEGSALHAGLTSDRVALAAGHRLVWLDRASLAPIGAPEQLSEPLRGFTSMEGSVLAWPAGGSVEPRVLTP